MELVRGGELFQRIVNQPTRCLPETECRYVFVQVIDALKYIHSKNVVHRDLKAQNVLIDSVTPTKGPEIKLSDFGHSKLIRDGYTRAESREVGTPTCLAPEVSDPGSLCYDERADLWSLGILLYLMLVGTYPFNAGDVRKELFRFPGSRRTEELVRGLIRAKPADRMTLNQCLESAWIVESLSALTSCESTAICQPETRVRLPRKPRKPKEFKATLEAWSRKQKVAAKFVVHEVVVTLAPSVDAARVRQVREDLLRLLVQDFPDIKEKNAPTMVQSGEVAGARAEESRELEATYGSNFEILSDTEWRIRLGPDDALRVHLPLEYPLSEAPRPVVECASRLKPWFSEEDLPVQLWSSGHRCIYDWVERVRDALIDQKLPSRGSSHSAVVTQVPRRGDDFDRAESGQITSVVEGEPLIIKGWSFRGYIVRVANQREAGEAHEAWLQTKAVAAATFSISAYRLESGPAQFLSSGDVGNRGRMAEAGHGLCELLDAQESENLLLMILRIKDTAIQNQVYLSPASLRRKDAKVARRLLNQWALRPRGGTASK